jgi:hypothetical protein
MTQTKILFDIKIRVQAQTLNDLTGGTVFSYRGKLWMVLCVTPDHRIPEDELAAVDLSNGTVSYLDLGIDSFSVIEEVTLSGIGS